MTTRSEHIELISDEHAPAAVAGLHPLSPERLPFAPSLAIRAFLLERDQGNVLIYSSSTLAGDAAQLEEWGGVSRHYLNHWHEALFAAGSLKAPVFVHQAERQRVEKSYRVRGTFTRRHRLDDDLEVIPTPGHTAGATTYLWDTGEHRVLFTGDTVYLDGDEWVAAVLDSSDREAYVESLELIRELDFDVLAPWAATQDRSPVSVVSRDEARQRVGALVARVSSGADH